MSKMVTIFNSQTGEIIKTLLCPDEHNIILGVNEKFREGDFPDDLYYFNLQTEQFDLKPEVTK